MTKDISPSQCLLGLAVALLAAIGVCYIFSAGYVGEDYPVRGNWLRQLFFLGVGTVAAWGMTRLDNRHRPWRLLVFAGYAASILLLLAVLLVGRSIGGARRWIAVGGFLLQPAEFAKLFTILAGAVVFSGELFKNRLKEALVGTALFAVPVVLMVAEPSYGNALSLLAPFAVLMGTRLLPGWLWSLALALTLIALGGVFYGVEHVRSHPELLAKAEETPDGGSRLLHGYHLRRLHSYLSDTGGWNERQAIMTIAGGGATGKGYLNGTMNKLGYLPRTVAPTDFIFAVLAEEGGFLFGVLPVIALYMLIFALLLHQAAHATTRLDFNLIAAGCALLVLHILVGIGMNLRLLPIIGLPLPLLSYGGSFTAATILLLGNMAAARHQEKGDAQAAAANGGDHILRLGPLFKLTIHCK